MNALRRAVLALALGCVLALAAGAARATTWGLPPSVTDGHVTPAVLGRLQRVVDPLPASHAVAVRYAGELDLEGHLARPGATTRYHSLRRILVAAPGVARQEWTTWTDADTTRDTEVTVLLGNRVLRQASSGARWVELRGRVAHEVAFTIWSAVPSLAGARALAAAGHGLGGNVLTQMSLYYWPDSLGVGLFQLNVVDLPTEVGLLWHEPRRGSVEQRATYFAASREAGMTWPDSLLTDGHPEGLEWRLREHRVGVEPLLPLTAIEVPDSVLTEDVAPPDTLPRVEVVGPHVWAVTLPDAGTRSLVLEFTDHLVVLETSKDVPHGEALHAAIRAHVSKKPVRFVSFSHHHPDYTGGLRTFMADTAVVMCPGSIVDYVLAMSGWSFLLQPDRLALLVDKGFVPKVDSLRAGRWTHADPMNEVVAIDIGARSQHTDAYVVFWLPRLHVLFEGDLGWYAAPGGLRESRRTAGLVQAIDAAGLAPATVWQAWPVDGVPASLPMRDLRAMVAGMPGLAPPPAPPGAPKRPAAAKRAPAAKPRPRAAK